MYFKLGKLKALWRMLRSLARSDEDASGAKR